MKQLLGTENFEILKSMYKESASVELLIAKFTQMAGNLTNENQRIEADHLSTFCQKIYGIESFDFGELTSWLSPDQVWFC